MLSLTDEERCLRDKQLSNNPDYPGLSPITLRALPLIPPNVSHNILVGVLQQDPFLAVAGMFADDPFASEVDAFVLAERERERSEAAHEASEDDQ